MKEPKLSLYQKLADIQAHVLGLGKDKDTSSQYNPKGYKYVTGSKVLENVKPLMVKHNIILKQEILSIDNERQDYAIKSGSKSEILSKVMMRFTWVDCETGDKDENLFGANGQNDWDKGVGSALTYAERYFLLKYFHINTDEDDIDNPERKSQEAAQPLSNEQKIRNAKDLNDLVAIWKAIPPSAEKDALLSVKDEMKVKLTPKTEE